MENTETQNRKSKKHQGIDWEQAAWHFGTIALQGMIGGMATAFGANVATKALNATKNKSPVSSGDNVIKFSKTGTV